MTISPDKINSRRVSGNGKRDDCLRHDIAETLRDSARTKTTIAKTQTAIIERIVRCIIESYKTGGKVVLLGNGGSAADAQHIASELVGRFMTDRQALSAISLATNSSIVTALANDYGYETVFSRQVEALVNKKDVVIGISTSGNSPSVIEAIQRARSMGAKTVGMTGGNGGQLAEVAELVWIAPSNITPRIQEAHITVGHIICELVERELSKA